MKTMRIIPWNEQMIPKGGEWVHAYKIVYSTKIWRKTPEQKRQEKLEQEQKSKESKE